MDQIYTIIILIIILIIVLLLIYYIKYDDIQRARYKQTWKKSSGIFDNEAYNTLQQIERVRHPNTEDNYVAANIIGYNLLNGRLLNARDNPNLAREVVGRYENILRDIGNGQNREEEIPFVIMIDDIDNFALNNIRELTDNLPENREFEEFVDGLLHLMNEIPQARNNTVENKRQESIRESHNQREYSENYINKSIHHTSQTQNVHDSSVVKDLNETFQKIRATEDISVDVQQTIIDIEHYAKELRDDEKISQDKYEKFQKAMTHILHDTFLISYNTSECHILKCVWDRTNIPENKKNSKIMKEAIIDEIANCVENKSVVCPGGRAGRLLGSLVTQDVDESLGAANTFEEYKNEIFQKCKNIIDEAVEEAKSSSDPELKKIGNSYDDPEIETDPRVEHKFKQTIKFKMDRIIDQYKDKMHQHQIADVRKDCHAAII